MPLELVNKGKHICLSQDIYGKIITQNVSSKDVDKPLNVFDYNKNINWLHFDPAVNNLNSDFLDFTFGFIICKFLIDCLAV